MSAFGDSRQVEGGGGVGCGARGYGEKAERYTVEWEKGGKVTACACYGKNLVRGSRNNG